MSEKARRSRAWDDANLQGPLLWPVKQLLRAFSSITLAVILLVSVAVYGATASIPVGLLVLGLTYAIYGLTILAAIVLLAGLPAWLLHRSLKASRGAGKRSSREFVAPFAALLVLAPLAVFLWYRFAWPALHYDPAIGTGLKLFADFVYEYKSVTIRRLPGVEMSELEYYSWWPLRVILLVFVVNMVTATVRRIDFNFKNIGVLTVHTGIVTIALGSIYYSGLKLEGDTLLLAGPVDPEKGLPGVGPSQDIFYDNTDVSLWVSQDRGWEQRQLSSVPRYNNYNLSAISGLSAWETSRRHAPWHHDHASDKTGAYGEHNHAPSRDLSLAVPHKADLAGGVPTLVDSDLRFRIVGYCYYAEAVTDWIKVDPAQQRGVSSEPDNPLRIVFLHSGLPDEKGVVSEADPVFAYTLLPAIPAQRLSTRFDGEQPVLSVEYTQANAGPGSAMPAQRWQDLAEPLPEDTTHALVIELPGTDGTPTRTVAPVSVGQSIKVGDFAVRLDELHAKPPFPIITKGYEKATSAVAVVSITPPASINEGKPFTRYVYSRFPEINQDIMGTREDGRPIRSSANPSIRVAFIEADHLAVYFDEPQGASGQVRAIVRQPGGKVRVIDDLSKTDQGALASASPDTEGLWLRNAVDKLSFRVGARWANAMQVDRPSPVPSIDQNKEDVGTHGKAMLAVEVTSTAPSLQGWKQVTWLPFSRYMGMGLGNERTLATPDGRFLTLSFGRTVHRFPTFALQLMDFQMIAYDHRGSPRDYQSVVRVSPMTDMGQRPEFKSYEHVTKLNEPLMAPFNFSEDRGLLANIFGRLASGLSPHQFKLSQAGWDQSGWNQTQAQADAGQIPRPYAKFTILGVGNNPGIHVIALGSILMGMGIPWAFYVKPWLVQRERKRLQELARARPAAGAGAGGAGAAKCGSKPTPA